MKIAIQNNEFGMRGGINTYSSRLQKYLENIEDKNVETKMFVSEIRDFDADIISVQYEPGMLKPQELSQMLQRFTQPIVVTAHHTLGLNQLYPMLDGVVLHSEDQITGDDKPWDYKIIPHPSLVFPKKDKEKLRKKYNLPTDKKIVGTMGFICGTGKALPDIVYNILKKLKDDEFLYLITSFWKGGDMGRYKQVLDTVRKLGKEDNFRIDADYVDEEILNEKMQCCDLLFAWNQTEHNAPGSQSGSAADMYGARVKLIVKDSPHYSFIGNQDKVIVGRSGLDEFVEDVINTLRNEDLNDIQNPEHLSWENMIREYLNYFEELV
jgi:hypothetical protein